MEQGGLDESARTLEFIEFRRNPGGPEARPGGVLEILNRQSEFPDSQQEFTAAAIQSPVGRTGGDGLGIKCDRIAKPADLGGPPGQQDLALHMVRSIRRPLPGLLKPGHPVWSLSRVDREGPEGVPQERQRLGAGGDHDPVAGSTRCAAPEKRTGDEDAQAPPHALYLACHQGGGQPWGDGWPPGGIGRLDRLRDHGHLQSDRRGGRGRVAAGPLGVTLPVTAAPR